MLLLRIQYRSLNALHNLSAVVIGKLQGLSSQVTLIEFK